MEACEICEIEAELLDGIYYGRPVRACHKCIRVNNIVLISKPSAAQLSGVKEYKVKDRLMQLANLYDKHREKHAIEAEVERKMLSAEEPNSGIIKKAREKAGITQEQLAREIGEDLEIVKAVEDGREMDEKIKKKLEQYLRVELEKSAEEEQREEEPKEGTGNDSERKVIGNVVSDEEKQVFNKKGAIDFKRKDITVGDLKKLRENDEE